MRTNYCFEILKLICFFCFSSFGLNAQVVKLTEEFQINESKSNGQIGLPKIALDKYDNAIIVWRNNNPISNILVKKIDRNGKVLIHEFIANSDLGYYINYHVAVNKKGQFVISWSEQGEITDTSNNIYVRLFNSDCTPLTNQIKVNTFPVRQTSPENNVGIDSSGNFVVIWCSFGNYQDLYARKFNNLGQPVTNPFLVPIDNSNNQSSYDISVADDGAFVVAWYSSSTLVSSDLYLKKFNKDCQPITGDVKLNPAKLNDYPHSVAIDMNDKQEVAVIYNTDESTASTYRIFAEVLNKDLSIKINRFVVNSNSINYYNIQPDIAINNKGNFVMTYAYNADGGTQYDVYFCKYDSIGNKLSSSINIINETKEGDQISGSIAYGENEYILIAWSSSISWDFNNYARAFVDCTPFPKIVLNNASYSNMSCHNINDGKIILNATGGFGELKYSINKDSIISKKSGIFENLNNGTYHITITDSTGCKLEFTKYLYNPSSLTYTTDSLTYNQSSNSYDLKIYASGGTGIIRYSIDSTKSFFSNSGKFNNLLPGNYYTAIADNNGCTTLGRKIEISLPDDILIGDIKENCKVSVINNEWLSVSIDSLSGKYFNIKCFNSNGQKLFDHMINDYLTTISIDKYNKGIYIYIIYSDNKIIKKGKFIK